MTSKRKPELRDPWLVAAWPGMGNVATLAGTYLADQLQPEPAGTIPQGKFFTIDHVDVHDGIARPGALPRNMFFAWRDPTDKRDLLIFLGEAQPAQGGYDLCRRIVEKAAGHGVKRVVTFASMATRVHPTDEPKVFGAVTAPELLSEFEARGVEPLKKGQVGGLNGSLLAAAAERGLPAVCLMGEFPLYAANVPNPKASIAVLEAFSDLSGIDLDLSGMQDHAVQMQSQLLDLLSRLRQDATEFAEQFEVSGEATPPLPPPQPDDESPPAIDVVTRDRIEALFGAAGDDRNRAKELKHELDRLGVFGQYEDRFLDLFRNAG